MHKGKLFIISGASGVGKSTVLGKVMAARQDLRFSVSATTRAPRQGEQDGVNYYFVDEQTFRSMIERGELLEHDYHNKTFYGTPRAQLEEKLEHGHVILDIDPMGAFQVRQRRPDATLIFIMPPSREELERRLVSRGDTSPEQTRIRLERAQWEMDQRCKYDHVVVNDQVDACVEKILNIIAQKADEE